MRKIFSLGLVLLLCGSLIGCNSTPTEDEDTAIESEQKVENETASETLNNEMYKTNMELLDGLNNVAVELESTIEPTIADYKSGAISRQEAIEFLEELKDTFDNSIKKLEDTKVNIFVYGNDFQKQVLENEYNDLMNFYNYNIDRIETILDEF